MVIVHNVSGGSFHRNGWTARHSHVCGNPPRPLCSILDGIKIRLQLGKQPWNIHRGGYVQSVRIDFVVFVDDGIAQSPKFMPRQLRDFFEELVG